MLDYKIYTGRAKDFFYSAGFPPRHGGVRDPRISTASLSLGRHSAHPILRAFSRPGAGLGASPADRPACGISPHPGGFCNPAGGAAIRLIVPWRKVCPACWRPGGGLVRGGIAPRPRLCRLTKTGCAGKVWAVASETRRVKIRLVSQRRGPIPPNRRNANGGASHTGDKQVLGFFRTATLCCLVQVFHIKTPF